MMRKEGQGERSNEEEGANRGVKNEKVVKKMKTRKVAGGRLVDPSGLFQPLKFVGNSSFKSKLSRPNQVTLMHIIIMKPYGIIILS